jgi:hypothetical protein
MYRCEYCKKEFNEPSIIHGFHNFPDYEICPHCGCCVIEVL